MFRRIRVWLENNQSAAHAIGWLTFAVSLAAIAVLVVLALMVGERTLLLSGALGVFTSLLIFGLGLLIVPGGDVDDRSGCKTRNEALVRLKSIIDNTGKKNPFCVMAVAATDFVTPNGVLTRRLCEALDNGMHARFILLNPRSDAAKVRAEFEDVHGTAGNYVTTLDIIAASMHFLANLRSHTKGKLDFVVHDHYGSFVCFNGHEMVFHPYFVSAVGNEVLVCETHCGQEAYRIGKSHFDQIWDYEIEKRKTRGASDICD